MRRPPRLIIASEAMDTLTRLASSSRDREVGGVVLGFRLDDDIHVEDVVAVIDPASTRNRYVLCAEPRDQAVRFYRSRQRSRSLVGYVGTWHSHLADAGPSCTDRRTFQRELWSAPDRLALMIVRATPLGSRPTALVGRPRRRASGAEVVVV